MNYKMQTSDIVQLEFFNEKMEKDKRINVLSMSLTYVLNSLVLISMRNESLEKYNHSYFRRVNMSYFLC